MNKGPTGMFIVTVGDRLLTVAVRRNRASRLPGAYQLPGSHQLPAAGRPENARMSPQGHNSTL